MIKIVPSNQFKKDLKLAKKRGFKIDNLRKVVNILACLGAETFRQVKTNSITYINKLFVSVKYI